MFQGKEDKRKHILFLTLVIGTDYPGLLGSKRGLLRQVRVQKGWTRNGSLLRGAQDIIDWEGSTVRRDQALCRDTFG